MAEVAGFACSASFGALAAALVKAQAAFAGIDKDRQAGGGSRVYKYADLASCLAAVGPALQGVGIALLQPTRVTFEGETAIVIATSLLIHADSGEWLSSDFSVGVSDGNDAQAIGSAATYARRYGLKALLAIEAEEADDDGVAARGGDHPIAKSHGAVKQVCPVCGKAAIIKGREEYGGGWLCFAKRGGCGAKWPEGPFPTEKPPLDHPLPEAKLAGIGAKAPYAQRQGSLIDTTTGEVLSEDVARGRMLANLMAWPVKLKWDAAKRAEIKVRHFGASDVNLQAVPLADLEKLHAEVYEAAIAAGIENERDLPL